MTKDEYISSNIVKLLHYWSNYAIALGALVILSLCILDYFVTPENFARFLFYRIIAGTLIFILFLFNRKEASRRKHHLLTILAAVVVSGMVSIMIAHFGGHRSPYFAGMILAAIFCIGLIPLGLHVSALILVIVYSLYLVPILIYDTITDWPFFINANLFILYCSFALIYLRYIMHLRYVRELSLQYDIEQQKKQLETYSHQLENMVQERTRELQKSEQQLRALFENATDGISVSDKNGTIVNVNNRICEMHGYSREDMIGTSVWRLEAENKPSVVQERMARLLAGESLVFETVRIKKDGTALPLEITSKAVPIGDELLIQFFYRDLTEKKKLQSHLLQSQKMESIGVLAGGIAHDFNNILTAILGHTEIVRLFPSLDAKSLRSLQVIEDVSRKAGAMINKLLGFARRSNYEILPVNINDIVSDSAKLLERVLDKNISLELKLSDSLPLVRGDFNQLEQVVMNLVVNARDAMPQGGRIVLTTAFMQVTGNTPDIPPYVLPGEYVQMSVADSGVGIPDHLVQKIFEPFFTTKERGKGTGLGLSMCYGAIMEHKGYITVQSGSGIGSTFKVLLPVLRAAAAPEAKPLFVPQKGTETILVVDDEEDILSAIQETLTAHGYKVLAANDPALGLEVFKRMPREVALVITDMVMPKIDGKELMNQLRAVNPEIRILAISGYMKYVAEKDEISATAWFLQKPFESRDLLMQIRLILDSYSHNPSPSSASGRFSP